MLLILALCILFLQRERAMVELNQKREILPELAVALWYSVGTMASLLQEIVRVYPLLLPDTLTPLASQRACDALLLLQSVASHPDTRTLLLSGMCTWSVEIHVQVLFVLVSELLPCPRCAFLRSAYSVISVPFFEHCHQNGALPEAPLHKFRSNRRACEGCRTWRIGCQWWSVPFASCVTEATLSVLFCFDRRPTIPT